MCSLCTAWAGQRGAVEVAAVGTIYTLGGVGGAYVGAVCRSRGCPLVTPLSTPGPLIPPLDVPHPLNLVPEPAYSSQIQALFVSVRTWRFALLRLWSSLE